MKSNYTMLKGLVRESVDRLGSRLFSLRSLMRVYDNWPGVLRVYFQGGQAHAILRDYVGNRSSLRLDENNVTEAIRLARALSMCWGRYELSSDATSICLTQYGESFGLSKVLSNGIQDLLGLSLLSHFNADVRHLGDEHYMIFIDSLAWVARKGTSDIFEGPLLNALAPPYLAESYEYKAWFLGALEAGDIFIDVGAYVGGYSLRACKIGAQVVALEPEGENFSILVKNIELNHCSRVHALNVAAGAREGMKPLYTAEQDTATFSLTRQGALRNYVKVVPLDKLLSPIANDGQVRLIKIDVEGAELQVLKGASDTLNRTRYLMIEVWPHTERQVLSLLSRKFKLVDIRKHSNNNYNALFKRI